MKNRRLTARTILITLCTAALLAATVLAAAGCSVISGVSATGTGGSVGTGGADGPVSLPQPGKSAYVVGTDISAEDITDFYYTYENINYNAFYQRYRFYTEDGKHLFFHETRERKDDYGPATDKDTTMIGTFELTDEEWAAFFDFLKGGKVINRVESAESGDRGPWLYLYWKGDPSEYQQFSFESAGTVLAFEEFCATLRDSR